MQKACAELFKTPHLNVNKHVFPHVTYEANKITNGEQL